MSDFPKKVYAFEWCSCVHESAFAIESLHESRLHAAKTMFAIANRRWHESRTESQQWPSHVRWKGLDDHAWRVREIEVQEDPVHAKERAYAASLREQFQLPKVARHPVEGDVVEVEGRLGICIGVHKGWCLVRGPEDSPSMDFIVDESRHGPCSKKWRIRHNL